MDLQAAYTFLNFWIGKVTGAWYPPETLDLITDRGQMAHYKDCYAQYGTSQRLTDALASFKTTFAFNSGNTPGGLIPTPSNYFDLIDLYTIVMDATNTPRRCPVPIINEDEITGRVNSQVIPMSVSKPFGELVGDWDIQLYPQVPQTGVMSYFRRPAAPHFAYTTVSGRVIVYNAGASTQLEWSDTEVDSVLLCTLQSIGINLTPQQLQEWATMREQMNVTSKVKT